MLQTSLLLVVFSRGLDPNDVHVNLLDAEVKGWGARSQDVLVSAGVLKEGILPQGSGVIPTLLPLVPVQTIRKLGKLFVAGDHAPVEVVMKVWGIIVVPVNGPGKVEAIHVVKEVNVVIVFKGLRVFTVSLSATAIGILQGGCSVNDVVDAHVQLSTVV